MLKDKALKIIKQILNTGEVSSNNDCEAFYDKNYHKVDDLLTEIKKLKHDIAVRDKALENAVSEICYLKDNLAFKSTKKCFINQAEQELAKEQK